MKIISVGSDKKIQTHQTVYASLGTVQNLPVRTRGRNVCKEERETAAAMVAGAYVDEHYCCGLLWWQLKKLVN